MAVNDKKRLAAGGVALVAVIGVVIGAVYGGRTLWGSGIGESCDDDFGCKPRHICISQRCRQSCKADADCQPGWSCRGSTVSVTPGGNAAKGYKLTSVYICFSPEAMAGVFAREREEALEKKRREHDELLRRKRFDVKMRILVLQVTETDKVADAQLDVAWAKLSDQEKTVSTVDALARKVIAVSKEP